MGVPTAVLALLATLLLQTPLPEPYFDTSATPAPTAAAATATVAPMSVARWVLVSPPMRFLGRVSYPLYLLQVCRRPPFLFAPV